MGSFSKELSAQLERLASRKEIATGMRGLLSLIFVPMGILAVSKGLDAQNVNTKTELILEGVAFAVGPRLLWGSVCSALDFLFVRRFFALMLETLDQRYSLWVGESPSLKLSMYRAYGTHKALIIVSRQWKKTAIFWILACIALWFLVVPPIALIYVGWIRFAVRRHASTERALLTTVQAKELEIDRLLRIENAADLNEFIVGVCKGLQEAAQAA